MIMLTDVKEGKMRCRVWDMWNVYAMWGIVMRCEI